MCPPDGGGHLTKRKNICIISAYFINFFILVVVVSLLFFFLKTAKKITGIATCQRSYIYGFLKEEKQTNNYNENKKINKICRNNTNIFPFCQMPTSVRWTHKCVTPNGGKALTIWALQMQYAFYFFLAKISQ
jgi:hypothetical protein